MKRLIAVLLVMGVIMTAFAETATGTAGRKEIRNEVTPAAETDVVLNLDQNVGIVWFSAGVNQNVSTYSLSLPEINKLNKSTSGNGNWVAKGTDLKLNWNIVSCSGVQIELMIDGPLVEQVEGQAEGQVDTNKIGWKISFKPTGYSGSSVKTVSSDTAVISAGYSSLTTDTLSATAVTKDNTVYGSSGTLSIDEIITENTYRKKVATYKATLIANVKTI
ncbi:MAG: hypothetical protein ACI4NB_10730 [Candidatus Ornithospirochaeta sp.]